MVVARYIGLAQQFLDEHPHEGYAAVSGAPPQCRATTRKGAACQRTPLAAQRLLPLPPAPRRHRGPRAGGSLSAARADARSARRLRCSWESTSAAPSPTPCSSATTARCTPRRCLDARASSRVGGARTRSRAVLDARGRASRARCERFAHGMTVATNALLEGRTARTALIATEGFTDVIELGRQARAAPLPAVRAPRRRRSSPPSCASARPSASDPEGPLRALERDAARRARASELARRGAGGGRGVAAALLRATPRTSGCSASCSRERAAGRARVALAASWSGTFREYERTATTVLDAALSPLLGAYLRRLLARGAPRAGLPRAADHAVLGRAHRRRAGRRRTPR